MARIDDLLANYKLRASHPLRSGLPLSQRVWFLVYPPEEERRVQNRIIEFEIATTAVPLLWHRIDLYGAFAQWMDTFDDEEERLAILADPGILEEYAQSMFRDHIRDLITKQLAAIPTDRMNRTVVALTGLMELYDLLHVSEVIEVMDNAFTGILAVFFPGERENNTYRFLGARTGWDYLAVPILADPQS
jgi:hypothetical protein